MVFVWLACSVVRERKQSRTTNHTNHTNHHEKDLACPRLLSFARLILNFMDIHQFFYDAQGRLRSGFRFVIFCLVLVLILIALSIPFAFIRMPENVARLASLFVMLLAAILAGWLCGRILEGLPFKALGIAFTKGWLVHFVVGLLVGGATLTFAVLIAFAFGGLRFEMNPVESSVLATGLGSSVILLILGAASEEAVFRGYPFQTLTRSGLAWLAILITSVFFGAAHLRNADAGAISTLNTILAGLWFCIAYLKTRDLWFAIGMHFMWNWAQGALFGIEISGFTDLAPAPLLKEIDAGPQWLTGTTYGIEGGIVTTVAIAISIAAIYYWPLKPSDTLVEETPRDSTADDVASAD